MRTAPALCILLLAGLLLPLAAAQNALDPVLTMKASAASVAVESGQKGVINLEFENTGSTAGDVQLVLPPVEGWRFSAERTTFSLASAARSAQVITLEAVPSEAARASAADAVFTASIRHATTGRGNSATASVHVSYVPPPAVLVAPAQPDRTGWIVSGSFAGLVGMAGFAFFLRSNSVRLAVPQRRRDIDRGNGGAFTVRVENRARTSRTVHLRIADVPPRWVAAFSFPKVTLRGQEATNVPVYVRVPSDTPTGAVGRVRIQARPARFSAWLARADLFTTVTDVRGERPNALTEPVPMSRQGALDQVLAARIT